MTHESRIQPSDPVVTYSTEGNYHTNLSGGSHDEAETAEEKTAAGTPWFVWPLLALSVLLGSSSGAIMKKMELQHAGAVSLAGWRFQVTAMVLLPCFLFQSLPMSCEARANLFLTGNVCQISLSSLGLAAYFGFWNWSILHTSLTHSFFLSLMTPLYIAFTTVLMGGSLKKLETCGVALGIAGSLILAAGGAEAQAGSETTLVGDLVAFLAAGGFALYLMASRSCRGSLPVYVYMFPPTVLTAIMLGIVGVLLEGWGSWFPGAPDSINGPFGWLRNREFLLWTIFLGIVPGFLCYVEYNIVLAFTNSLVVSMALAVFPLSGSLLGWLMGLADKPQLIYVRRRCIDDECHDHC
ncbi:hypothetical protein R1flu_024147 [Riccia fluitans]|uniref:EamA domain-containing protein n=1 Tax=Riccia fluitans TaxID=41844 RepID=A0ABD1XU20_9MARC